MPPQPPLRLYSSPWSWMESWCLENINELFKKITVFFRHFLKYFFARDVSWDDLFLLFFLIFFHLNVENKDFLI